jgi:hypothetical protein
MIVLVYFSFIGKLLFIPQMIFEYGQSRWNDIDRGKPKNPVSTTNPT